MSDYLKIQNCTHKKKIGFKENIIFKLIFFGELGFWQN